MLTDKTLTASSEADAIAKVEAVFPGSYVHSFGEAANGFDICVYDSEEDFDADANDGDNHRIKARYAVKIEG